MQVTDSENQPSASGFISRLVSEYQVPEDQVRILKAIGVSNAESLVAVLQSFPTLSAVASLDTPMLSAIAQADLPNSPAAAAFTMQNPSELPPDASVELGAQVPDDAPWQPGSTLDLQTVLDIPAASAVALNAAPPAAASTTNRTTAWGVKDQGGRSTCVSFSIVALLEAKITGDFSEQIQHWATKKFVDPSVSEATYIKNGMNSLLGYGPCPSAMCAYNPAPIPGNPSQDGTAYGPSAVAIAAARASRLIGPAAIGHRFTHTVMAGKAALLKGVLAERGVAAISLPVFIDPLTRKGNWTTQVGWQFGNVINPPPGFVMDGAHATCAIGFVEDEGEALGGYFIIRNSWGNVWGHNLPSAGYHALAPGYGQVSALYVDKYLYEIGYLT